MASYSPLDVDRLQGLGVAAPHLPHAFDRTAARRAPSPAATRCVRRRPLPGARAACSACTGRLPVRAYGRDWSHHPVDRLRTWSGTGPTSRARDLDRATAYAVMAAATATLNMHGDQDGFTMRTFEACGVGGAPARRPDRHGGLYDDGVELVAS